MRPLKKRVVSWIRLCRRQKSVNHRIGVGDSMDENSTILWHRSGSASAAHRPTESKSTDQKTNREGDERDCVAPRGIENETEEWRAAGAERQSDEHTQSPYHSEGI